MKSKMDATMRLMDEIDSLREVARNTAKQGDDVELLARVREVYASQGLEADEKIFSQAFQNLYGRKPGEQALVPTPASPLLAPAALSAAAPVPVTPVYGAGAAVGAGLLFLIAAALVTWLAVLPQGAIMGQVTGPSFAARVAAYWSQFSAETTAALHVLRALGITLAIPVGLWTFWKMFKTVPSTLVRWLEPSPAAREVSKATIVVATSSSAYLEIIRQALGNSYEIHVAHDEASVRLACLILRTPALVIVDATFIAVVENQDLNGVRAVVLVGAFDKVSEEAVLALPGVVGVLSKPLTLSEIKAAVWEHVGRDQVRDTLMTAFCGPF